MNVRRDQIIVGIGRLRPVKSMPVTVAVNVIDVMASLIKNMAVPNEIWSRRTSTRALPLFRIQWTGRLGILRKPVQRQQPNDVVNTPFTTGVGGTISGKWDFPKEIQTTLALQLPNILSGHSYINFHTTQFGGGEIRGALEVVSTPEPSTMAMFALAGLGLLVRRTRRTLPNAHAKARSSPS